MTPPAGIISSHSVWLPMQLAPNTVVERYIVEGLLGQGGMAVVYRVRHQTLDTFHALKLLTLTSPSIRRRLLKEGKWQAALRHPNIVTVTDVIEFENSPGLIMELVDGPNLDSLIQQHRLTLDQVDALVDGILSGVGHAHRVGIIHRDLKPANILLQVTVQGLVPKVTDFGLAKVLATDNAGAAGRTRSGATMGTPAYMAPEQIRSSKYVDQRADIFSLGAILYELVCGKKAFDNEDLLELYNSIADGAYLPPRQIVPDLPKRMETAIVAALTADRNRRTPDVEALRSLWFSGNEVPSASSTALWSTEVMNTARSSASRSPVNLLTDAEPGAAATYVATPAPAPRKVERSITTLEREGVRPAKVAEAERRPEVEKAPPTERNVLRSAITAAAVGCSAVVVGAFVAWQVTGGVRGGAASVLPEVVEPPSTASQTPVEPENPVTPSEPVPAAVTDSGPKSSAKATKPVTNWLYVNSRPWSHVRLDGVPSGQTHWRREVAVGRHQIVLSLDDGTEHRQTLQVTAATPTTFCWDFALNAECPR